MKAAALVVAILLLLASARSDAALTAGQKMAAEALIKQFSAAEFDTRQKAVDRLVELGPDVIPLVKKALAETADNEVKLRCEMVLKKLGAEEPAAKATNYDASKITLEAKDMPIGDVVEQLAQLSGNTRISVAPALKDKTVTLSLKDVTYWEAVQAVCDKINALVMGDWRRMTARGEEYGWFQLLAADKDAKLRDFSGPVIVHADSCVKSLAYRHAKGYAMGYGMAGGVTLSMSYYYEDRLSAILSEMEIKRILAPDGKDIPLPANPIFRGNQWGMGTGGGTQQLPPFSTAMVMLPEAPEDLAKIAELSGVVRLTFGSGEKEVTIDDVLNAVGKEMKFDDWTVRILKAEKSKWGLQVQVEAKYKDQPVDIPPWMTAGGYGWWVKGAEGGKKTRGYSYGGYGGLLARAPAGQGEAVAVNPAPPKKGESTVMFQGNFEAGTWSLTLLLPAVHETREYPFTLKDIPLP